MGGAKKKNNKKRAFAGYILPILKVDAWRSMIDIYSPGDFDHKPQHPLNIYLQKRSRDLFPAAEFKIVKRIKHPCAIYRNGYSYKFNCAKTRGIFFSRR